MKTKTILFILTLAFFSCTKNEKENILSTHSTKSDFERKSATCAISGTHTFRGLDYANTTSYSGTFVRNADNSVTASISSVTSLSTDKQTMFARDNSSINASTSEIDIPSTGTYWYVPLDISYAPIKLTGGTSVTYRCDCKNGGTGDCNVEINDCDVSCQLETCTEHCCLEEEDPIPVRPAGGSGVILETAKLILNGTVYE